MIKEEVTNRTIGIYIQIAEKAMLSKEPSLSKSMLFAAFDQVQNFSHPVDQKTLIKLAELLTLAQLTEQAEEIFNSASKASLQEATTVGCGQGSSMD